jgi:XTP/dITP diphosphohydrolase
MELVFATANQNKVIEVQKLIGQKFKLLSLKDINYTEEIPETADTFKGNALQKAKFIYDKFKLNCFADDSGLEVEVLNGAPGVYSARFAGEPKNDANNTKKLLNELQGKINRKACFKTAIVLIVDGKEEFFEGKITGQITQNPIGKDGFGYDPVFMPDGYNKTFAQMTLEEKNIISHRAIAIQRLVHFLAAKA